MTKPKPVRWCDLCGTDLAIGSFCYRLGDLHVCPDCLLTFARQYFHGALEPVE